MRAEYHNPILRQLSDQQGRFARRDQQLDQINRAEALLGEITSEKTYTYEYLCYRITGFRPEANVDRSLSGKEAQHDLRVFVEDLSEAAKLNVDEVGETVHTVDDLSRMFNVSTKTISRWREQGLVSRRFFFGRRRRVGFLQSSVDRFVADNRDKVKRGERFSKVSDTERDEMVDRARRLSRAGGCPAEVARRVAAQLGRSVETIRYTLKQFDEMNPQVALFPGKTGPMTTESKRSIYEGYRQGESVDQLASRHCRTKTSIYRIINEMRAIAIIELPLDFIDNDLFHKPYAAKKVLADPPENPSASPKPRVPAGLPPYLASLYDAPLMTKDQEQYWFRRYNYLKYRTTRLRNSIDPAQAKSSLMDEIDELYDEIVAIKNRIVQANLRLVVSIAKRHVGSGDDFFSLVSDGNMSLYRAVEKFDYGRGFKFSTYASWAIMKNFARTIPQEFKQLDRFRTSTEELFSGTTDDRTDQYQLESAQQVRELQIGRILDRLDEREQKIIISRFGLDHRQEPQTLKEVGAEMGVTKERIRQIEVRALTKLRLAAREEQIELIE